MGQFDMFRIGMALAIDQVWTSSLGIGPLDVFYV